MPRMRYQGPDLETYAERERPMIQVGDGRVALSDAVRNVWLTNPDLQQVRAGLRGLRQYGPTVSRAYEGAAAQMRQAARAFAPAYAQVVRAAWHEVF